MTGNTQYGGSCLNITDIPKFPFYPQTVTVQYYNSQVGKTISKTIRLIDCNHDDPSCEDYYELLNQTIYSSKYYEGQYKLDDLSRESRNSESKDELQIVVYDIMGNIVSMPSDQIFNNQNINPKILIFTYWDKTGKMVKYKKVLKY